MTIFEKLMSKNEFPVVFIGSGLSKRFLENFPDWATLLKEFWDELGFDNFYGTYNNLRDQISKAHKEYGDKELDHYTNIKMGTIIEENYNNAFNSNEVQIDGFSTEDAYESKISPFKIAISNRFKSYKLRDCSTKEYESLKKMLLKTQILLTTNYDRFIEDSYNKSSEYKITKYIGQKGFFQDTFGYAEIYKLHGCIESPADIIITEKDYERFEDNSVLISAKIISMMMNSPIIFIGYSLTDINVRKIIKDFTRSLSGDEIHVLENRLVLIEWQKGEKDFIEEVYNDNDLGCKLKVIKTDNFERLFNTITKINQGVAPTEVRKFQHVIKKLIIDRGKKGTLNSVLLAPEDLDKLESSLLTKNITVAIGDSTYIFQIPDIISYCLDYISDKDEISTEIRMRFAVIQISQAPNSRFPINKLLDLEQITSSGLHPSEKQKLIQKIPHFTNFQYHYDKIISSSVFNRKTTKIEEIIYVKTKDVNIFETLSYNIQRLDLEELKRYIVSELTLLKEKGEFKINTQFRRLLLLYDIVKNKRDNA